MLTEPRVVDTRTSRFKLTDVKRNEFRSISGRIDLFTTFTNKKTVWHTKGIYTIKDGRFKYCIGRPNGARPDAFVTRPGDGRTLATLRRAMNGK